MLSIEKIEQLNSGHHDGNWIREFGLATEKGTAAAAAAADGAGAAAGPALPDPVLRALASTMERAGLDIDRSRNSELFAGYTYLGQFIDHDMTHDPTPLDTTANTMSNRRSPVLDLDSLYGSGPEGPEGPKSERAIYADKVRLRCCTNDLRREFDLCREFRLAVGGPPQYVRTFIADQRNDSNLILGQLHLAFIRFHNRVADSVGPERDGFECTRRIVTEHYHWIIEKEFLPAIIGQEIVDELLASEDAFILIHKGSLREMPPWFARAAFRFGHSMVRTFYQLQKGGGAFIVFDSSRPDGGRIDDLRGFSDMRPDEIIDWELFFPASGDGPLGPHPQLASPIDATLSKPLMALPFVVTGDRSADGRSLAYRNLRRGANLCAQDFIKQHPGVIAGEDRLDTASRPMDFSRANWGNIADVGGSGVDKDTVIREVRARTPLWYYILMEAQVFHRGERLGPLGSRIVGEVVIAAMKSSPRYRGKGRSDWQPEAGQYGCRRTGHYKMSDFLRYAGGG